MAKEKSEAELVNMNNMLRFKSLVSRGELRAYEAAKLMGISLYLYDKWSKQIDEVSK